ncbi:MAG TPA: hypothetical protein VL501_00980, partial [Pyrinomonadaceae bacterium]|nr:hypothetical protein [Pyrinomonadaceae bacterium]
DRALLASAGSSGHRRHREIITMDLAGDIAASLGDDQLPRLYEKRVRTLRTRSLSIEVPARENAVSIEYTLLGIELKVGKRRFASPDLATARYMRVFARIGCGEFAIPYDITKISPIADELETSWQRTLLLIDHATANKTPRARASARSKVIRTIRDEIAAIGPGDVMPAFDRETRQRG